MNVTIEGYVSYTCTGCKETYNVDGKSLTFNEDSSQESEEDESIRYVSELAAPCRSCGQDMGIKLDVWEYPESVANYSYYSVQGVSGIECEFTIEHYFDDEAAKKEEGEYEPEIEESTEDETDEDVSSEASKGGDQYGSELDGSIKEDADEKVYNEASTVEGYTDQYDPEE